MPTRVRVNLTDAQELLELPGLSPTEAEIIVRFRAEHGPIGDADQLARILGGHPIHDMLKERADFSRPTAPPPGLRVLGGAREQVCGEIVKRVVLAALLALAVTEPVHAQVSVNIGIQLPGPPTLMVIPGAAVYYAPRAPENIFFYAHQYWLFTGGGWYVGHTWNGPWAGVAPARIPIPILRVPVRYYRVPPPHWKGDRRDAPPQWEAHYGREWHEEAHERAWREREERWDRGGHEGRGRGH